METTASLCGASVWRICAARLCGETLRQVGGLLGFGVHASVPAAHRGCQDAVRQGQVARSSSFRCQDIGPRPGILRPPLIRPSSQTRSPQQQRTQDRPEAWHLARTRRRRPAPAGSAHRNTLLPAPPIRSHRACRGARQGFDKHDLSEVEGLSRHGPSPTPVSSRVSVSSRTPASSRAPGAVRGRGCAQAPSPWRCG